MDQSICIEYQEAATSWIDAIATFDAQESARAAIVAMATAIEADHVDYAGTVALIVESL